MSVRFNPTMMQECIDCSIRMQRNQFPKGSLTISGVQRYYRRCNLCLSKKRRPYMKQYHSQNYNAERVRNRQIKRYGITTEEYEKMLLSQGGVCLICKQKEKRQLSIDHNHTSGEVRGLLCRICNSTLGLVEEDIIRLERMINYIKQGGNLK